MSLTTSLAPNVLTFAPLSRPENRLTHSRVPANRLTARDRIEMLRWQDEARLHGYTRVTVEEGADADEPELGDFLMIYRSGAAWASWAVGCCSGGFTVWRPTTCATLGWFATIRQALQSILTVEEG